MEAIGIFFRNETGGEFARSDPRMLHNGANEINIVAQPLNLETIKRCDLQVGGFVTGLSPRDELGNHWVVEHANFAAVIDTVVYTYAINAAAAILGSIVCPTFNGRLVPGEPARTW